LTASVVLALMAEGRSNIGIARALGYRDHRSKTRPAHPRQVGACWELGRSPPCLGGSHLSRPLRRRAAAHRRVGRRARPSRRYRPLSPPARAVSSRTGGNGRHRRPEGSATPYGQHVSRIPGWAITANANICTVPSILQSAHAPWTGQGRPVVIGASSGAEINMR
jgi:hypothetical protein